ncbi:MAG: hypothetical protein IJ608_05805 [Lachnospiraceae bacterium]|nr:hypothetical protein [Lachnospiraceae bacterium]
MDCIKVIFGDCTLGVQGDREGRSFELIFSYAKGGLVSLVSDKKEWIYRAPQPAFWRALTDNDRGAGFHLKSGIWLSADMFIKTANIEVTLDKKEYGFPAAPLTNDFKSAVEGNILKVKYTYETVTNPVTAVSIEYEINSDGEIKVHAHYFGKEGLPELPVFGVRIIMPTLAENYRYEGLSGETYPDRMTGGKQGVYDMEGLSVTPYILPQDCGMHMDTDWLEIYRKKVLDNTKNEERLSVLRFEVLNTAGAGSLDTAHGKFAFSCLPYTPSELENALHREELPTPRRTVLTIYGAVRGVGGIDTWGSEPEPPYRVSGEEDHEVGFRIVV